MSEEHVPTTRQLIIAYTDSFNNIKAGVGTNVSVNREAYLYTIELLLDYLEFAEKVDKAATLKKMPDKSWEQLL